MSGAELPMLLINSSAPDVYSKIKREGREK